MSSTVTHSHTPHALRSCAGIGRPAWPAAVGRAHHRPAAPVRGRLPSPPPWQGTTGQHRNCMSISVLPPYQAGHLQGQHHQLCVASIFPVPAAAGGAYRGRHHKCMASLPRRRRRQGTLGPVPPCVVNILPPPYRKAGQGGAGTTSVASISTVFAAVGRADQASTTSAWPTYPPSSPT